MIWRFNPPHASHFGGVWERMIGIARRILDAMLLDVKHGQLIDEVLATFMAEVAAIMNSRPLVAVSSDCEMSHLLSPGKLLTQKTSDDIIVPQDLSIKDMYRSQWRMVQVMANTFWKRWKSEFLFARQARSKWNLETVNHKVGGVVFLRDKECPRLSWPTGLVTKIFPSDDGLVLKLGIRVVKDGKPSVFIRPISEVIPPLDSCE
ncbi:uncharacterized protein LOC132563436 [Ylistrum balloti]|uniref:uncharacterized protein LOC132563436 n=1 Tax=Ylistrum balloti TaxID=509963 RepID=UPI002905B9C1|nr:uncharacterized protein LOC132563436 [Ylistrum balloti]